MKLLNLSISDFLEFSDSDIKQILRWENSRTDYSKEILGRSNILNEKEIEIAA